MFSWFSSDKEAPKKEGPPIAKTLAKNESDQVSEEFPDAFAMSTPQGESENERTYAALKILGIEMKADSALPGRMDAWRQRLIREGRGQ